jgi:hypothetical protein
VKWLVLGLAEIAVFLAVVGVGESQALRLVNAALATITAFILGVMVSAHVMGWRRP